MPEAPRVKIRHLSDDDDFRNIKTGDEAFLPLKNFINNRAKSYENAHLTRTYVLYEPDATKRQPIGYITLMSTVLDTAQVPLVDDIPPEELDGHLPEVDVDYPYTTYPAIRVARLLVDVRHRGNRYGEKLIAHAFMIAVNLIAPQIGCRFFVVDAKPKSVAFYERCGFKRFRQVRKTERVDGAVVMFLDLNDVLNSTHRSDGGKGGWGGFLPT